MKVSFLADKSALARSTMKPVAERLDPLIKTGRIATCSIVELEYLYSARSPSHYARTRVNFELGYRNVPIDQPVLDRAVDVQAQLAKRSAHRGASIPDLIIAAAAESADLAVLHYDADYDLIAEVTGQPMEWVVPTGSVD